MRAITHDRAYEYVCPECKHKLPPIDRDGKEIVLRRCVRFKRHDKGTSVLMKLVKLDYPKTFSFKSD